MSKYKIGEEGGFGGFAEDGSFSTSSSVCMFCRETYVQHSKQMVDALKSIMEILDKEEPQGYSKFRARLCRACDEVYEELDELQRIAMKRVIRENPLANELTIYDVLDYIDEHGAQLRKEVVENGL